MFCTAKYRGGVRRTEGLVLQRYYMPSFQPLSSSLSLLCLSPIFPLRKHRGEVLVPSITGTERYVSPSSYVWSSHIGKVARRDGEVKKYPQQRKRINLIDESEMGLLPKNSSLKFKPIPPRIFYRIVVLRFRIIFLHEERYESPRRKFL